MAEDTTQIQRVTIAGEAHAVFLPEFIVREELIAAWGETQSKGGMRLIRAAAAMIGACTRLGKRSKQTLAGHSYDVLGYGGAVYTHLTETGAGKAEIVTAGQAILPVLLANLSPREAAVAERAGFSEGGEAGSTAPPSA